MKLEGRWDFGQYFPFSQSWSWHSQQFWGDFWPVATRTPLRNATHPKTQVMDRSENLRFRVCCVFGCVLAPPQRRTKSTRKRNTPENADSRNGPVPAFSGVLRFRVLFVLLWLSRIIFIVSDFCPILKGNRRFRGKQRTRKKNAPNSMTFNWEYSNDPWPCEVGVLLTLQKHRKT